MRAHLSVAIACALYLLLGLVVGNVLATGQAEPLRWFSVSIYFAATLAFFLKPSFRRKPESSSTGHVQSAGAPGVCRDDCLNYIIAAVLSGLTVLIFCGVAGSHWNFGYAALLGVVNFALLVLFALLFRWKRLAPLLLGLALIGGLLLPARIYFWPLEPATPIKRSGDSGLTILTSLPIAPFGQGNLETAFRKPTHPTYAYLSRHFAENFADSLEALPRRRLLLAQPRALQPADLVALDGWIRAGGEAVILADPLLTWRSELSPADTRRPPVTSLLDPLLAHWGLHLEAAEQENAGVTQRRLANSRLLAMSAPGHFTLSGKACRLEEQGLIAHCRLGRGSALLLADADMLHPDLWMGGNGSWSSLDRDRLSDNMLLLAQWLGRQEEDLPPPTGWILTNRDICYGLAAGAAPILVWGLLAIGWARSRRGKDGTRRETRVISGELSSK